MAQGTAITIRASAEVLAAIDARAEQEFCKRSVAAAALLEAAVAQSTGTPPSPSAQLKEVEQRLKITAMERRDAREASLLIWREEAEDFIAALLGEVKADAMGFLTELARDNGMNLRELQNKFMETVGRHFAVPTDQVGELADKCADTAR